MAASGQAHREVRQGNHCVGLARIIHDGSHSIVRVEPILY